MVPMKRVTVGVDFAKGSMNALSHAVRLAHGDAASISAVHVVDPLVVEDLADALKKDVRTVRADVERSAREAWARVAASWKLTDADLEVVFDAPVNGLVSASASSSLLVIGTHAEAGERVGVGVVASGCAQRASCPVLIVHPQQGGPFRRICVGVDFSPPARDALDHAAWIAEREGAELHVVHVFQAPWHKLHYRAPTPEADPEFMRNYRGTLDRMVASLADRAGETLGAARVHRHLIDAPRHGTALVRCASEYAADLIVVGATGRRGIQSLILGSTAERVCRDTTTSVLVVRPLAAGA